jgi:hypothetical protein
MHGHDRRVDSQNLNHLHGKCKRERRITTTKDSIQANNDTLVCIISLLMLVVN